MSCPRLQQLITFSIIVFRGGCVLVAALPSRFCHLFASEAITRAVIYSPRFDRDTKEVRPEKATRAQLWLPLQCGCMYTAQARKDGRKGTVTRHSSILCCSERNGSAHQCCMARDMTGLLLAGKRCTYSSGIKAYSPRERAREQGPIGCCIYKHIYIYRQGQRDAARHGGGFRVFRQLRMGLYCTRGEIA